MTVFVRPKVDLGPDCSGSHKTPKTEEKTLGDPVRLTGR